METLEYLGIAFVCSVLLIIMSKIILQSLIRRPADYYDAEELRQEELMLNAGGISLASEHETTPEGEIMEDTHLEAHTTGDIKAAEPEEIFAEISESVTESIESRQPAEEELDFDTDDETGVFIDEISEIEHEPEVIEGSGSEPAEETEEPEPAEKAEEIPEDGEEAEPELCEEAEPEISEEEESGLCEEAEPEVSEEEEPEISVEAEPEVIEETGPEQAEETEEPEAAQESEEEPDSGLAPFEFRIKARTTRERKPIKPVKKAEAEETKEEEQEKTAPEGEQEGWAESYDEIRNSLEQAYTKKKKKSNRRRKPSMNMNRTELINIAESMGISIPEDATKRTILGLIYEEKKNGRNHR